MVEGDGDGGAESIISTAIIEEFEAEEATAERGWGVRDVAGVLHVTAKFGRRGERDEEARGGQFFAEAEHGVYVALARKTDEEDMGEGIHGGSHLLVLCVLGFLVFKG